MRNTRHEMIEGMAKDRDAQASDVERESAIRAELRALGVVDVDAVYESIQGTVYHSRTGELCGLPGNPMKEWVAQCVGVSQLASNRQIVGEAIAADMENQPATRKTCSHTEELARIIAAGHYQFLCEVCKLEACDDCAADWKVCHGCSGSICDDCLPKMAARYNGSDPKRRTTEYLCSACNNKREGARAELAVKIAEAQTAIANKFVWIDEIVTDLEAAIHAAKHKGDL